MSSALEHPIGPTTVADWLGLDSPLDGSRLELLYGHLHVTPPPTGPHQWACDELRALIKTAIRAAGRSDLYVLTGVGIEISTGWRTAAIPDLAVLNDKPLGAIFTADQAVLLVEIWSPSNRRRDREEKRSAYAAAGVPAFWEIDKGRVTAQYLENRRYVPEVSARPGERMTVRRATPVPVTFDPAELSL